MLKQRLVNAINREFFTNNYNLEGFPIKTLDSLPKGTEVPSELNMLLHDANHIETDRFGLSTLGKEYLVQHYVLEKKIRKNFNELPLSVALLEALIVLEKISNEVYLVGGCIRDICTDKIPKDYDICTDISYKDLIKPFSEAGFSYKETGKQFLVLIVSKYGEDFEIAQFRRDKDNEEGIPGTIEEDSQRRDLGVNAGYLRTTDMTLKDPSGQFVYDISDNLLRFIGKPADRIIEDPLRVYRFYRFVQKGFKPDTRSLKEVRRLFNAATEEVSKERIRTELERIVGL